MDNEWLEKLKEKKLPGTALTTLIVDGNVYFSGVLESFLENAGHVVLKAQTAEEGVAKTREYKPDVILLNNELKETTGLEVLPEILIEHPSAAVILLAPRPSIPEAVTAIRMGALDYIEGPLEPVKFKAIIETHTAFIKQV